MSIEVLLRSHPHRSIALLTSAYALVLRHSHLSLPNGSTAAAAGTAEGAALRSRSGGGVARCIVDFSARCDLDLREYRPLTPLTVQGTLGLVALDKVVFLCLVSESTRVATVRPGETVQRIDAVEFCGFFPLTSSASFPPLLLLPFLSYPPYANLWKDCLSNSDYDYASYDAADALSLDSHGQDYGYERREPVQDHPCSELRKLLSSGSFYYSGDFDLTRRLQDRSVTLATH
jgi:hypothetical protein